MTLFVIINFFLVVIKIKRQPGNPFLLTSCGIDSRQLSKIKISIDRKQILYQFAFKG